MLKKITSILVMVVLLLSCKKDNAVMLSSASDSLTAILSEYANLTTTASAGRHSIEFTDFSTLRKVMDNFLKHSRDTFYIQQVNTLDTEKTEPSCGINEGDFNKVTILENGNSTSLFLYAITPSREEWYVRTLIKSLNPFVSYLITYKISGNWQFGYRSSNHAVQIIGLSFCMHIENLTAFDMSSSATTVITKVQWTTVLQKLGIRLTAPMYYEVSARIFH